VEFTDARTFTPVCIHKENNLGKPWILPTASVQPTRVGNMLDCISIVRPRLRREDEKEGEGEEHVDGEAAVLRGDLVLRRGNVAFGEGFRIDWTGPLLSAFFCF
jgi:hypothetical protein